MLCGACIFLIKKSPNFRYTSSGELQTDPHHESNVSLAKAASSGCRICKILLQYCQKKSGPDFNCILETRGYKTQGKEVTENVTIILKIFGGSQPFISEHTFKVVQASGRETVDIYERNAYEKTESGIQTAKMWMQQCLTHHTKCRGNVQPSSYPTRLLRLNKSTVRLVAPSQEIISGPYAALSYCWGNVEATWSLTTSNLASRYKNDIQLTDLPVSFQEAISFAQSLSIYYLWIDSLCIIQSGDEGKDWDAECGETQNVYENCILNISIAHGKTPSQSYFDKDSGELVYPFTTIIDMSKQHLLRHDLRRTGEPPLVRDRVFKIVLIIEENFVDKHLFELPINDRAWVLQEQFLSPRVLSLGHGQLFWNCIGLENASESCPHGLGHLGSRERLRSFPGKEFHEQQFFWKAMIERYSNRQLTFVGKDKLVAFSAIAEKMATMTESKYIAGHFWDQLPQSLPWQVVKNTGKCPQRKNTHTSQNGRQITTPSWSWASMDGRIEMPIMSTATRSVKSIAEMLDFNLDLACKENLYGQVVSANLILRAHYAEVQCTDGSPTILDHSIILNGSTSWNGNNVSSWWIIDDPKDDLQDGDRCAIVALSKVESTESVYGLVVREVQNSTVSVHARIGYYCIKGPITVLQTMEAWHGEKREITLV